MEWSAKVKLFEQLRREYECGVGTIWGVARKFGVHRRLVRQAVALIASVPEQTVFLIRERSGDIGDLWRALDRGPVVP